MKQNLKQTARERFAAMTLFSIDLSPFQSGTSSDGEGEW